MKKSVKLKKSDLIFARLVRQSSDTLYYTPSSRQRLRFESFFMLIFAKTLHRANMLIINTYDQ